MHRPVMPDSIAPPAANYAHAIATEGASRWLHTSGVVPVAADGTTPTSVGEQAQVVWSNIVAMLGEVGMEPSDIVSVTTYVVATGDASGDVHAGFADDLRAVMAARDAVLGDHRAASTLVTAPALAQPAWKMEVAVVAAR